MTAPIESTLCTASTPGEAKVLVARLQAAGIPARVEGDNLVDEFAAARRLVNLMGTRVMVPTSAIEQARELLVLPEIDADELTRQALAAPVETPPERVTQWHEPAEKTSRWIVRTIVAFWVLCAIGAIVYALS